MTLRLILLRLCCTLSLVASAVVAQERAQLAPLPLKEGLAALSFGFTPIALCPRDQQWIAYQLNDIRRLEKTADKYSYITRTGVPSAARGGDIWLTNTRTGETRNLTSGVRSNWAPAWSPNGKYLAFFSDRGGRAAVWMWERTTGQLRQVSPPIVRPFLSGHDLPLWTPDSRFVLIRIFPETGNLEEALRKERSTSVTQAHKSNAEMVDVLIYQSAAEPGRASKPEPAGTDALTSDQVRDFASDLALVDIRTGKLQRVAQGYVPAGYWLSPDGERVAFLDDKGRNASGRPAFDLLVVSVLDREVKVLVRDVIQGTLGDRLSWSPNGKLICYLSAQDWFLVPATGGMPRKATEARQPAFSVWEQSALWSSDGLSLYLFSKDAAWKISSVDGEATEVGRVENKRIRWIVTGSNGSFWSPDDGRSLVVATRDDQSKQMGFYKIDLATRHATRLIEENCDLGGALWTEAINDGRDFYYVAQTASRGLDIWKASTEQESVPRRVTHVNPVFDRYVMGESRLVEWQSGDGERLRGALMLPAGYQPGKRYPLIVHVYGGALLSDTINSFGFSSGMVTNEQFWATRGYAVLLPDTPLRVGTPMVDLAKTVMPGVDRIIEMGIADPDRLAVWGSSYGGYSTVALIAQTTRFKSAICDAGVASLLTAYGRMNTESIRWQGWLENGQGRMGGTPWQYRQRYIENSPLLYLGSVQTPTLIIQGTADPGAKDYLSDELFICMQRLGKEARYLKYEGAGHTILSFSYAEQVDVLNRMVAWFDGHLKG